MAENISKEELEKEIAKILENANLAQTSTKKVRQRLEEKFGVELTKKRKLIDQLVMDYVNSKDEEDNDDDGDEEEASEEEVKKPVKRSTQAWLPKKAPAKKSRKASSEEDEDDDDDSDDEPKKKPKKKAAAKPAKDKKASGGGRGKGSGYTRAYKLTPALADLMGEEAMPRHEVVKRMWALIKSRDLFDPNNKQFAICDEQLYKVIGAKRFRTFGMMKYLKNHFIDD